jgi:hypothetical protein
MSAVQTMTWPQAQGQGVTYQQWRKEQEEVRVKALRAAEKTRNIICFTVAGLIGLVLGGGWYAENYTAQGRVDTAVAKTRSELNHIALVRWANSPAGIEWFAAEEARKKAEAAKAKADFDNSSFGKWWNGTPTCQYRAVKQADGSFILFDC